MAESAQSGGADIATVDPAREEEELSASLAASEAQMRANAEALWKRSIARTALGYQSGALEDAQRAAALCPDQAKYHIRASETLWACGNLEQASIPHERARILLNSDRESVHPGVRDIFATMDRRLRPFHYLPQEILVPIFEHVMQDWQRLDDPFQLCQVCSQWRKVAFSTPTLWRDTRILGVEEKLPVVRDELSNSVPQAYCFGSGWELSNDSCGNPRARNQKTLLKLCASLSRNTLTHFAFDSFVADGKFVRDAFDIIKPSAATLLNISIVNRDEREDLLVESFRLISQCPRLEELELSLGRIHEDSLDDLEATILSLPHMPASLRSLKLDSFDWLSAEPDSPVDNFLLQRCSRLESLTLVEDPLRKLYPPPLEVFGPRLLAECANSLTDLQLSIDIDFFSVSKSPGLRALPELRRFRHVREAHLQKSTKLFTMDLPNLDCVEGTILFICQIERAPKSVVLRFDRTSPFRQGSPSTWLVDSDDFYRKLDEVQDLTILVLNDYKSPDDFNELIDAFTPSVAGVVHCPRLQSFAILLKDEYAVGCAEGYPFLLDSARRREPIVREEWEGLIDVSRVVRMETERMRLSQGLPVEAKQRQLTDFFGDGGHSMANAQVPCAALRTVTIEGCRVEESAWEQMRASTCEYRVEPNPEEMMKLACAKDPAKKKRNLEGEVEGEQQRKKASLW